MDTQNSIYFSKGRYIFGYDYFSDKADSPANVISIDRFNFVPLSDASVAGLVFVERDKKQGVLNIDSCGQGGYGACVYASNIFPFLYDEMLLNGSFNGRDIGYVAVRINHCWGILRVEGDVLEQSRRARRPCMMIIPCIYPSKEAAIAQIRPNPDYHPEYGWREPFEGNNLSTKDE